MSPDLNMATPQMPGWRTVGNGNGFGRISCRNPECRMAQLGRSHIEYRGEASLNVHCRGCGWTFLPQFPQPQQAQQVPQVRQQTPIQQQQLPRRRKRQGAGKGKGKGKGAGGPTGPTKGSGKGSGRTTPQGSRGCGTDGLASEVKELKEKLDKALKALADPAVSREEVAASLAPPKAKPSVNSAQNKVDHLQRVLTDKGTKVTKLKEQLEQALRDHANVTAQLAEAEEERDALYREKMREPAPESASSSMPNADDAISSMKQQSPEDRKKSAQKIMEYIRSSDFNETQDTKKPKCEAGVSGPPSGTTAVSSPSQPPVAANVTQLPEQGSVTELSPINVPLPEDTNVNKSPQDKPDIEMTESANKKRGHSEIDNGYMQDLLNRAAAAVGGPPVATDGFSTPSG